MNDLTRKLFLTGTILLVLLWGMLVPSSETVEIKPSLPSLIPPLLAISMALLTREVILSLFCGVWIGATMMMGYNPVTGLLATIDTHIINSIIDSDQAKILLFTLGFGGVIGVVSANGGMKGVVNSASKYASTRKRSQLATMLMGVVIFFDDYANTLFVGNMMRPFTDRLKVSREKLAYIVDSTAAPVASLAIISTWSVFQMSLLETPYKAYGITENPYITFINSIPYSFYCILTVIFMGYLLWTGRDYSNMLKAERRATLEGKVLADGAQPLSDAEMTKTGMFASGASHWTNAMVPILLVVFITMVGLYVTGTSSLAPGDHHSIRNIIGSSDPYRALIWGSLLAGIIAILLSNGRGILTLRKGVESWVQGAKSMLMACMILVLAWTLGDICAEVKTADYIISLTEGILTPALLPAVTFLTAALVSFCTGTSWGTMPILVPIAVPLAFKLLGGDPNIALAEPIYLATFASVLSGCVFGDHCSPLSDTTILSSIASGSDHVDHVRTQLPYAMTTGIISFVFGYAMVSYLPVVLAIALGAIVVIAVVKFLGRRVDA
ncbi:MAG: sodium:proton antiporter [Candidatus Marinimicrobia bacterium]|nr:sodium:proton antiporter [Candidatus Neomarinimicrobiota bacterium]